MEFTEKQKRATNLRQALDPILMRVRELNVQRPSKGWIRSIRDALGMSAAQLGKRLELDQSTVSRFEENELKGTITLDSLSKVAKALECELVYTFVPRTSLEDILKNRAHMLFQRLENRAEKTMVLEAQASSQFKDAVRQALLALRLDKRLWEDE